MLSMLRLNSPKILNHCIAAYKGKVEFENVSFRFNPHAAPVVKSVSFSVDSGKFIGIVGRVVVGRALS